MVSECISSAGAEKTDRAVGKACCVDIEEWDFAVVQLPDGDSGLAELVSFFWTPATYGKMSGRIPPALAVRHKGRDCVVMPRSSLVPSMSDSMKVAATEQDVKWTGLQLSTSEALGHLHSILSEAGFEALVFAVTTVEKPRVLLKSADVQSAARLLLTSGFAVGPPSLLSRAVHEPTGIRPLLDDRAGMWVHYAPGEASAEGVDLPYHCRFEAADGLFIDIRIPTRTSDGSASSVEASCCGYSLAEDGDSSRHCTLSLQPATLGNLDMNDAAFTWKRHSHSCTAVLELLSIGPHIGFWIFSGGYFARITGLPRGKGVVGGYCCREMGMLEELMGKAVEAELRGQYEAILGRVERPSVLRVLRRSCQEPLSNNESVLLYDGENGTGGLVEVDREAGLVVHHLHGGGEQRWRILAMEEDPFTPPGGTRLPVDAVEARLLKARTSIDNKEAGKKKDGHRRSSSSSPSIVLFDDKKAGKDKHKSDRSSSSSRKREKRKHHDREKNKDRDKDKDRGKGKEKDHDSARSDSEDKKRKKKRKDSSSSSADGKKDKKKSSKDEKKKRSRSRKSRSRSRSRRKKAHSRSRSKKKRSRSKSKRKKKSRSRSRSRRLTSRVNKGKDMEEDTDSRSLMADKDKRSKGDHSAKLRHRLALFDSKAPSSDGLIPISGGTRDGLAPSVPGVPVMSGLLSEASPEVEAFLAMNPVEGNAAARLRSLPAHIVRLVIHRGSLLGARDPAAVLNSRIRDAMQGPQVSLPMAAAPQSSLLGHAGHPGVEALIARYSIDAQPAQLLRSLPPHLQAAAVELPMHEARNPSAFLMAQLQLPRFRQG